MQRCIHSTSLHPGHTDRDSGHTKFKRVRQFGCTDRAFGYTKSKHWHPISGFWKLISNLANEIQGNASKYISKIQIRCANWRDGAFQSVYLDRLAQLLLCITARKISWSCFHLTLKWSKQLFETRANPAEHKATASEVPSKSKPAKSFCHRWLNEFK